jgi:hypothetical protein
MRLTLPIIQRKSVVPVPLCERCRLHWRRYHWLTAGIALAFLVLMALHVVWVQATWGSLLEIRNQRAVEMLLLGLLGLAALVVVAAALFKPPIRAKEITERTITLTGVADSFPGAVSSRAWWKRNRR